MGYRYYRIIDGQRYDASLITNAEFRVRGKGDGRISKEDAQTLWRLAMDGGRITEIEERTLAYLLAAFNFTEAARQWLEEEMNREVTQTSSYYKVIDGLKYDRSILDKAEELTQGRGDGRISYEDAQFLWPLFGDAGDLRIEEERTLDYLLKHYSWTEKAQSWFLPQIEAISKESDAIGRASAILRDEFALEHLGLDIDRSVLRRQSVEYANAIDFPGALIRALNSLLHDIRKGSLAYTTVNVFELHPEVPTTVDNRLEVRIRQLLSNGVLILLEDESDLAEDDRNYDLPPNGESFADFWLFGLTVADLSDLFFWVAVKRDGSEVYNYGAN